MTAGPSPVEMTSPAIRGHEGRPATGTLTPSTSKLSPLLTVAIGVCARALHTHPKAIMSSPRIYANPLRISWYVHSTPVGAMPQESFLVNQFGWVPLTCQYDAFEIQM